MNTQQSLFFDKVPTLDEVMSAWGEERKWLTRAEIAKRLGRAKSPALIAQIGILVGMQYLASQTVTLPNHVDMYMYCPTNAWVEAGHVEF
jgi:hypothetical protein